MKLKEFLSLGNTTTCLPSVYPRAPSSLPIFPVASVAGNVGAEVIGLSPLSTFQGRYLRVKLLDHLVILSMHF